MPSKPEANGQGGDPPAKSDHELRRILSDLQSEVRRLREDLNADTGKTPLLTREEAAKRLRISKRTLDDMAAAGEIQPVRIRGRVLYHSETLEAYVRRQARGESS